MQSNDSRQVATDALEELAEALAGVARVQDSTFGLLAAIECGDEGCEVPVWASVEYGKGGGA